MKKAKHSKFRNSGILWELLTRQITADILSGKDESLAKNLLYKYFSESTELGKEWQLYSFLLNERVKTESSAEKYISTALKQREKLDSRTLTLEKYNLIKELKDAYPLDELLKSSIKNYKMYASIYKLLENHVSTNSHFNITEIVQSKNCILEHLTEQKKPAIESEEEIYKEYRTQNEDIRLLSYKILVDSLNEKYKGLNEDQKNLLREYINNVSNTNSLNKFVIQEIGVIKRNLSELCTRIPDEIIKIKINETINQITKINPTKNVKDSQITVLLQSYELIKEINNVLTK